jgi:hypothetical protein
MGMGRSETLCEQYRIYHTMRGSLASRSGKLAFSMVVCMALGDSWQRRGTSVHSRLRGTVPIARPSDATQHQATQIVNQLVLTRRETAERVALLHGWYVHELNVTKPSQSLLEPAVLSSDQFVEQFRKARGVRKPLSAAGLQAVREVFVQTVQPVQAALREAERLEWRLNDLVNKPMASRRTRCG